MRFTRGRTRVAAVVATPLVVVLGSACRSPTEVTLTVTTDVKCADFDGAAIAVGTAADVETKPPATVTTTCSNSGSVGSLVIVPSGSDDEQIVIRVAGGVDRDPTTCSDDGDLTGCIIARRSVRFEEHTAQVVALALESACAGVVCATDQTCIAGTCLSDVGDPAAEEGDGGLDATVPPGEASTPLPDAAGSPDGSTGGSEGGSAGPTPFDAGPTPDANAPSPPCSDGSDPAAIWASTRRCGTNDARSPFLGSTAAVPALTCSSVGGGVLTPLAVDAAGSVYMGGDDGTLRLFDPNLNPLSSLALGNTALLSGVLAAGDLLYVSSATAVYRVSVAGKTLQAAGVLESPAGGTTSAALQAPVLARDGTLVVGTDLQMSGFGAGFPGTAKWSFAPSATSDAPLLAVGVAPDGTLLGTWSDLPVYAVSVSGSGTVASESNAPAGTLVGGLGHVYAWSKTGISVIDGATSGTSSIVGVALQSDAVVVMYNHGKQGGVGAYLALLDPASLATNGTAAVIEAEIASPPVVDADDSVYFLTVDGRLHVRKANSNQSFDAGAPASTFPAPIIGNGAVYLGGIAGGGVCVYR